MENLSPYADVPIPDPRTGYPSKGSGEKGSVDNRVVKAAVSVFSSVPIPNPSTGHVLGSNIQCNLEEEKADIGEITRLLEGVDLNGEVQLPDGKLMTYDQIAAMGKGWKFHLNFDAENVGITEEVRRFLMAIRETGAITTFKIGHGGGKKFDQPGKEATIYVGHRDKAEIIAPFIEKALGVLLDDPGEDVLVDDRPFTEHVWGRFEVANLDDDFSNYGKGGSLFLSRDALAMGVTALWSRIASSREEFLENIAVPSGERLLRERYGVYYAGSKL